MGELNLERSNVKFDLWERKLLDLSTRNSLLNLRIKGTSIPLFVPGCAKIEDYIAQEKNFSIISRGDEEEIEEEETSEETEAKEVPDAIKPVEETEAKEEPAPLEAMAAKLTRRSLQKIMQSKIFRKSPNSRNTSRSSMRRVCSSHLLRVQLLIRTSRHFTEVPKLQWKRTAPIRCSSHADS